jgi:hypothetical protein
MENHLRAARDMVCFAYIIQCSRFSDTYLFCAVPDLDSLLLKMVIRIRAFVEFDQDYFVFWTRTRLSRHFYLFFTLEIKVVSMLNLCSRLLL